jgi:hypothetical protein
MRRKLTIEQMQQIALGRGGWCLSYEYFYANTKLWWQCGDGHVWKAAPDRIKQGRWCPDCGGTKKLTLEEMQNIALENGGICLSDKYTNSKTKLKFKCKQGHKFDITPSKIKQGRWCPICGRKKQADKLRGNIDEMHEIAKSRGGKCLSSEYKTNIDKLKWKCKEGHIWDATPNKIKQGRWCPYCSTGFSERVCRKYFEIIFNKKFPKKKYSWLINTSGNKMELDGYCDELNLAFEYQGRQHYESIAFRRYSKLFDKLKKDDDLKQKQCKANNVTLITIPYSVELKNMQKYIVEECKKKSIELPEKINFVDFRKLDVYNKESLKILKKIAEDKGGKCLSNKYISTYTKLKWECNKGHIWEATPGNVIQGRWCPTCAGNIRLTIEEMHEIAKSRGGKCLSSGYKTNMYKLEWKCKEGHTWYAIPNNIKRGQWCPECFKIKRKQGLTKYNRNYKIFPHTHKF